LVELDYEALATTPPPKVVPAIAAADPDPPPDVAELVAVLLATLLLDVLVEVLEFIAITSQFAAGATYVVSPKGIGNIPHPLVQSSIDYNSCDSAED